MLMMTVKFLLFLCSLHIAMTICSSSNHWNPDKVVYPKARREDIKFPYKSAKEKNATVFIPDPYNYFENSTSPESIEFQKEEQGLTESYLAQCPFNQYKESIRRFYNYSQFEVPTISGSTDDPAYVFGETKWNENRPVYYLATAKEVETAIKNNFTQLPGKKFFDVNLLSSDGSKDVYGLRVSPDGKKVAYGYNDGGGVNSTVYVRLTSSPFIEKGRQPPIPGGDGRLSDELIFEQYSGLYWNTESSGLYYATEPLGSESPSQVKYHVLGTKQEEDVVLLTVDIDQDNTYWDMYVSEDRQWIMASPLASTDRHAPLIIASLNQTLSEKMNWITISPAFDSLFFYAKNVGNEFYFGTNTDNASNFKIVKCTVDPNQAKTFTGINQISGQTKCEDLIPERSDSYMENVILVGEGKALLVYTGFDTDDLFLYDFDSGKMLEQVLESEKGSYNFGYYPTSSIEGWGLFETFNKPNSLYRFQWIKSSEETTNQDDISSFKATLVDDAKIEGIDINSFEIHLQNATSKDGTQVPFYSLSKKGVKLDGSAPLLLYFYGVYGINTFPYYDPQFISWVESHPNSFFVLANPRGGSEVGGQAWHFNGMLEKRQNNFDDVFAVAKRTIELNMTSPGKIIAEGVSAAGTSAMVLANQDQDNLFSSVIAVSGVYDMLRYKLLPNGEQQVPEYGDPDDPKDFDFLIKFSPLQNVNKTKVYPSIVLVSSQNDGLVSPVFTAKMIAELQYDLPKNPNPLLWYSVGNSGHRQKGSVLEIEQYAVEQCVTDLQLGIVIN